MSESTISSIAKATVIGTISSPAEVVRTQSGRALTKFRVQVDEVYQDRARQRQVRSSEHPITYWGEHVVPVGSMVYIEARLSSRSFESRGETRYATEIVAEKVVYLASSAERGDRPEESSRYSPPPTSTSDEDIPF